VMQWWASWKTRWIRHLRCNYCLIQLTWGWKLHPSLFKNHF
jgi:hypothetical protein